MPVPLPRRRERAGPALETVQTVDGSQQEIDGIVKILRKAGCVVEPPVELEPGRWQITARSQD